MFYDPGEMSSLRGPPLSGPNSFTLELVNQSRGSGTFGHPRSDNFTLGQVVWLVRHDSSSQGWNLTTEGDGPFIIVDYHFSRCVLVDRHSNIFPETVHSRF